jgi:hypothetical protein
MLIVSIALPPVSLARPKHERTRKEQNSPRHSRPRSNTLSLRQFEVREISRVLRAALPKNFFAALLERVASAILHTFEQCLEERDYVECTTTDPILAARRQAISGSAGPCATVQTLDPAAEAPA